MNKKKKSQWNASLTSLKVFDVPENLSDSENTQRDLVLPWLF